MEAASNLTDLDREEKYREIASTAESGWDFSSRWGLRTTHVIPTDLNCFLLMMERNMQGFAQAGRSLLRRPTGPLSWHLFSPLEGVQCE